ncbi:MAG: VOC family protein [Alphaproteobacteria bacterium]|jgi:catechol 2,3-dioxygenase-like lactoylglutathione lyase family enzyme|nr:VOC family protein [Alphaproteobacteria bacterium]MDP6516436.1 VOC family protein [Alphaproteobacteria bacterium]|tara:strand:+ start:46 stop:480 length:435 start_codon:yes stop_codon:yes gene_type:complete
MTVQSLDHYTINPTELDTSVAFYETVIGLRNGERPDFPFPGAWLYCGDRPVLHFIGDNSDGTGPGSGALDHVAFRCTGLEAYTQGLRDRNIEFIERDVPGVPLHQVFFKDPDGVKVELNFWDEAEADTDTTTEYQLPKVPKVAE